MKPLHYLVHLLLPALVIAGYALGGWWNFLLPACCFLAYPVINLFLSPASENHTHSHEDVASSAYSQIALVFVPVLIGLTAWCIYSVSKPNIQGVSFYGLVLSVGIVNGVLGFTLAHEFSHRFTKTEMLAGYLLLLQNNYLHYRIEHVWGHHVYACTAEDPHTARIGESVYAYLPRAIATSYKNAFRIEAKRLSGSGIKRPLMRNRILLFGLLQIALLLMIIFTLGWQACLFFLLQSIIAIFILHIINYMQHYGLMRKKHSTGNYEKINAQHAWNNGRQNNSLSLFQLENHADHHMHPAKSFDKLNHQENSPEHPAGYSAMFLLALLPPLWFKVMNKRIPSHLLN
jgi:alkane 1-monooxygenase